MCEARTPQLYRLRNGNFIVFNIGLKGSWIFESGAKTINHFPKGRSEVQPNEVLIPVILV